MKQTASHGSGPWSQNYCPRLSSTKSISNLWSHAVHTVRRDFWVTHVKRFLMTNSEVAGGSKNIETAI